MKKLTFRETIFVASMLFGMFFGAGNLIFPVSMGQMAGRNMWQAAAGFLVTGVGLPLLSVAALGISRENGLQGLASRVGKKFGIFFTCALYLTIGPFFATPRCASVSFTVGIERILPANAVSGSGYMLWQAAFSFLFFAVVLFFSLRPGEIMTWIGKVLNPVFLVMLGTDNGVNFTDGLDGLCTSVTILVATFLTIVALGEESGISPITGAVAGSLLGFLLFNVYPTRVFMGDTGSLALGGFVAASAFMMQLPLFIPLVGLIYLAEVLSVIIQVTYFKKTGGKRIFKMAPIHHHFELCGWSETRVVAVFSIITAILCLVAYLGL